MILYPLFDLHDNVRISKHSYRIQPVTKLFFNEGFLTQWFVTTGPFREIYLHSKIVRISCKFVPKSMDGWLVGWLDELLWVWRILLPNAQRNSHYLQLNLRITVCEKDVKTQYVTFVMSAQPFCLLSFLTMKPRFFIYSSPFALSVNLMK